MFFFVRILSFVSVYHYSYRRNKLEIGGGGGGFVSKFFFHDLGLPHSQRHNNNPTTDDAKLV